MKKLFLVLLSVFGLESVYSQQVGVAGGGDSYDRNALTVLFLDNNVRFHNNVADAMNRIEIPNKFDDNMLETRVLDGTGDVMTQLKAKHIANDIIAKWFSRGEDGAFDMSVVHERGMYNATDADVIAASASKLGLAKLQDAGENLVAHSYILVLSYKSIKTMDQIYDEQDARRRALYKDPEPVARPKIGYRAELVGYLYKLSDVKNMMQNFYNTMWVFDNDDLETKQNKKQIFDQTEFPLTFVSSSLITAEGTELRYSTVKPSSERQILYLVNNSVSSLIYSFENKISDMKVRTALYSKYPLKAKIGKKESLSVDDRYFVYEYRMNSNNEVYADRRGVIRAKKVADNRRVATGNNDDSVGMSKFYQVAGHSLDEGMFLEQSNDAGVGVTFGYGAGALSGANMKIEVLTGPLTNIPQLKAFLAGHVSFGEYDLRKTCYKFGNDSDLEDAKILFYGGEFGVSKGVYLFHNFSLSGHVLIAAEWADLLDSDLSEDYLDNKKIVGVFVGAGAQATVNLRYNMQLVGSLTYYSGAGNAFTSSDKDDEKNGNDSGGSNTDINARYSDLFEGRADAANISFGLRIEF